MTINQLNVASEKTAFDAFFACCGSTSWATQMAESRPFTSVEHVKQLSDRFWNQTTEQDWVEAFSHHPEIGDSESLKKRFASTAAWALTEQASVQYADDEILDNLAKGNRAYADKFGFIFIVCATGKSAAEMLFHLNSRLPNSRETELKIAAAEQHKITSIRIDKLLG